MTSSGNDGSDSEHTRDIDRRLKARLEDVDRRLKSNSGEPSGLTEAERRRRGSALGKAFRLSTELVAGVAGGGVLGYFLDQWLGTRPWLLLLFLLLGVAAGLLNAIRTARDLGRDT